MQTKKHDPAFPCITENDDEDTIPMEGLSKREFFAAIALQGFIASKQALETPESLAMDAVNAADALILILNKSESELPNKY